jgi:hypothetical protein
MGRAGVGRIKSMAYTYSTEILINVFLFCLMKKVLFRFSPPQPSPSGEGAASPFNLLFLINLNTHPMSVAKLLILMLKT